MSGGSRTAFPAAPIEDPRLGVARKTIYGTGDYTVNTVLSSLSLVFHTYFLIQVAGLRPELAGAVQLIGRMVDAFTDPAMGRISDHSKLRAGRRRPFFLMGAVPFGLSFALLWAEAPFQTQTALFAYYAAVYVALSVSMTMLSVPYLALLPEMALGYDARNSLNTYRNAGSVLGVLAAICVRPVAGLFGGGPAGFAWMGAAYGVMLALPWFALFWGAWERSDFQRRTAVVSFREGLRVLLHHRSFRLLTGMYLCGRVSMDLVGAMLILYFTYWLGRGDDFELTMALFLVVVLASLPIWLRISRHTEKVTIFAVGSVWWMLAQILILTAEPDWPRWITLAFAPLVAVGYAVVDLMPWSMLGEVVDEDELATGERREGLFYGLFMFLRKLAGTIAVALALGLLGALGYQQGAEQNEATVDAIRWMTSLSPALFLGLSVLFARGYPLDRRRHAQILAELAARGRAH